MNLGLRVFVYGTLKPSESNYTRYCAGKVTEELPALAQGELFALPMGYPAMTAGSSWVQGYLLSFKDSSMLARLDWLEDYDPCRSPEENEYQRHWIDVFDPHKKIIGAAWAYVMSSEQVARYGGIPLPEGIWSGI
ncbi:MAG: gamma-glutamylcyclotransferase [Leptolyngbyaceae cyanobacterium bins.59]|nr:gamma-glutamylcyclotransferase [Leptolyngbyaceae cyanobacterium bins.59]